MLVVGAGPVGLLMALLLHHEGVKATIIERQPKLYPLPRAVCLDNESQRLLWNAGLEESLKPWLELESNGLNFTWRDREKKPLVSMDWDKPGPTGGHALLLHTPRELMRSTGYPQVSGFNQPQLEGCIEKEVLRLGLDFRRGFGE